MADIRTHTFLAFAVLNNMVFTKQAVVFPPEIVNNIFNVYCLLPSHFNFFAVFLFA